jgi:phosphatidate cytidylyltransferase
VAAARRPGPERRRTASTRSGGARSRSLGRSAPRRGGGSDLFARIIVAVPAAVVAILFVSLGGLPWALFMIAIGWVCMYELYGLLDRWRPLPLIGFASLAAMVLAARYGGQKDVLEVAVATLPVLVLFVMTRQELRGATVAVAGTLLGIYWLGFAFAHAVLLRQLPHGSGIVVDVLLGTFLGDTAAYLGGRLFGRRPLAPRISPNKTVEGLFCGMLIAVIAVFFAGIYQTWLTPGDALLLGAAVAVLGPLGDLFESLVKRNSGTKDAGVLFGAHGGALDRLDAVIFTMVAGYYIWAGVVH